MQSITPDIVRLAKALAEYEVKYVLIGGMAMMLHGSDYVTTDSDLALSGDPANLNLLIEALRPLNPRPLRAASGFAWDTGAIAGPWCHVVTDAGVVDIIRRLPGVESFQALYERSVVLRIEGADVHVASIDDLISMKKDSSREKDAAHTRELLALKQLQAKDEPDVK